MMDRRAVHVSLNIVVQIGEFIVLFVELSRFLEIIVPQGT